MASLPIQGVSRINGLLSQLLMMHDGMNRIETDPSGTDRGMTVLPGSARVFAVIDMHDPDAVQSDDAVKLFKDAVQVVDDIVTGVVDMACIHADREAVVFFHLLDHAGDFLEGPSHFRPFA